MFRIRRCSGLLATLGMLGWTRAAEAAGGEQKGLLDLNLDLAVWSLVVFVLLLLILRKLAWKPMLEGLRKREQTIESAMEEAKKAREEAALMEARLKAEMATAADKVREILEEARRDAQHTSEAMIAKARGEIQTERDRLRREMETARDQALKQIWGEAAELATLISAKAVRRSLSADDHRRLVDEALADLRSAGEQRRRETAGV